MVSSLIFASSSSTAVTETAPPLQPSALPVRVAPGTRSEAASPPLTLAVGCQVSSMSEPTFTPMVSAISLPTSTSRPFWG